MRSRKKKFIVPLKNTLILKDGIFGIVPLNPNPKLPPIRKPPEGPFVPESRKLSLCRSNSVLRSSDGLLLDLEPLLPSWSCILISLAIDAADVEGWLLFSEAAAAAVSWATASGGTLPEADDVAAAALLEDLEWDFCCCKGRAVTKAVLKNDP